MGSTANTSTGRATRLRYCANEAHGVCNWLVRDDSSSQFCAACDLNRTIPNLADPANVLAWGEFERAKKRLVYSLRRLDLPLDGAAVGKAPLELRLPQRRASPDTSMASSR